MSDSMTDEEGLKDIELCYTAMGLSIGDSPDKIQMTYNRLSEMYKANLAAPDPKAREEAKESLKLIEEMHDKIKKSVTYQSMAREYEKRGKLQGADRSRSSSSGAGVLASTTMNCPMCHTVINKKSKVCPRCKARIYTPFEKAMNKIFTKTNVIIFFCLVIIGVIAVIGYLFSDQIMELVNSFRS
jgi:rubrerythrin